MTPIQTLITLIPIVLLWVRTPVPQKIWDVFIPLVEELRPTPLRWLGIELIGLLDCVKCISFWLLFGVTGDFILAVQGALIAIAANAVLNHLED